MSNIAFWIAKAPIAQDTTIIGATAANGTRRIEAKTGTVVSTSTRSATTIKNRSRDRRSASEFIADAGADDVAGEFRGIGHGSGFSGQRIFVFNQSRGIHLP